jgi:integrase
MSKSGSRKSNGSGYTYKNGKSFRTVIVDKGRTITASGPTAAVSRKNAQAKLLALPIIAGGFVARGGNITLGQFLISWLENEHKKKIAETTYLRYHGLATRYIIPALGRINLRNLSKRHINSLLDQMHLAGQSPRSIQQARALLSVALNAALEDELISVNPVKFVKNPTVQMGNRHPLTAVEANRLVKCVDGTFMLARIHVAIFCGLRQGEALGLRWSDIDFESGALHVRHQIQKKNGVRQLVPLKTHSSRRVLFPNESTLKALRSHKEIIETMKSAAGDSWANNDLVFPNKMGNPIQSKWDYEKWMRSLDNAKLSRRRLHDARHTAGTLLHEMGVDIETIRRILGHSNIALTSRTYLHAAETPIREAFNKLDRLET